MGAFLGYLCERFFIFFRKHESPTKVKGTVHAPRHIFKTTNNLGATKHIKMVEKLKYSFFQAQFVITIFTMCQVFLIHIHAFLLISKFKAAANFSAALTCIASGTVSKHEQVISPILQRVPSNKCKWQETDVYFLIINLTRISSMLRPLELDVQPLLYLQHMPDRSMLVLSCASAVISSVVSSCFIYEPVKSTKLAFLRNTLLSVPSGNPTSENPPMPSEFQFKEPLHAFEIPKSRPWYRYGYFLELPNTTLKYMYIVYTV